MSCQPNWLGLKSSSEFHWIECSPAETTQAPRPFWYWCEHSGWRRPGDFDRIWLLRELLWFPRNPYRPRFRVQVCHHLRGHPEGEEGICGKSLLTRGKTDVGFEVVHDAGSQPGWFCPGSALSGAEVTPAIHLRDSTSNDSAWPLTGFNIYSNREKKIRFASALCENFELSKSTLKAFEFGTILKSTERRMSSLVNLNL